MARDGHPISSRDPLTAGETARVIALGVRIERLKALGKKCGHLERQVDGIITNARAREEQREADRQAEREKRRRSRW